MDRAEAEYVQGTETLAALAQRLGLREGAVRYRSRKGKWSLRRKAYRRESVERSTNEVEKEDNRKEYSKAGAEMEAIQYNSSTCGKSREKVGKNRSTCGVKDGDLEKNNSTELVGFEGKREDASTMDFNFGKNRLEPSKTGLEICEKLEDTSTEGVEDCVEEMESSTEGGNGLIILESGSTQGEKMGKIRGSSSICMDCEGEKGREHSTGEEIRGKNGKKSSTGAAQLLEGDPVCSTMGEIGLENHLNYSTEDEKSLEELPISSTIDADRRLRRLYGVADRLLERLETEVGQERLFSEKSFLRQVTGSLKDLKDILELKPGKEEGQEKFRIAMDKEWEEFSQ